MKFLIVSLAIVGVALAAPQFNGQAQQAQQAVIVKQASDSSPDGSYNYNYETDNGLVVSETGVPTPIGEKGANVVVVQGSYQYPGEDGKPVFVTYVADQNGFQPEGEHLPTPHPIPEAIQRALEFIAKNPPKPDH